VCSVASDALADQLVSYLALGGGVVRIPAVTDHLATCVDLVDASGFEVADEERPDGAVLAGNGPGG
jgi:RNA 3'-terminal phosphate cyclase (ATP)